MPNDCRLRTYTRFSLRAVALVMSGTCLSLAYVSWRVATIRLEQRCINELIAGQSQARSPSIAVSWQPPASRWGRVLHWCAGAPGEATKIDVSDTASLAAVKSHHQELRSLTELRYLPNSGKDYQVGPITHHDIELIASIRWIQTLRIQGIPSQDFSLHALGSLPNLIELELRLDDGVAEDKLAEIGELKNLEYLTLILVPGSPLTHNSLRPLGQLPSLRHITISGGEPDDKGFIGLATARNLKYLTLSVNSVTDTGLAVAAPHLHLAYLNLGSSKITDRSVEILEMMRELAFLHVGDTSISKDGIDRLRIARPDMLIK
jgi:hypothetical protein